MERDMSHKKNRSIEVIGSIAVIIVFIYLINVVYNASENFFSQFSWGKEDLCEMPLMFGAEAQEIGDFDAINEILTDRFEMRENLDCPVFTPNSIAKNMSIVVTILFLGSAYFLVYKVVEMFETKK